MAMKPFLAKVAKGESLDTGEAREVFELMISGVATSAQIGALLMGLRVRGETTAEITGGAMALRAKATALDAPDGAMDVVGTGGDGKGTFNVSTATAFVVSACGVPVAKHGNRAVSSRSGSADVLKSLGVNIDADLATVREALFRARICFMFAPRHHGAMRNVAEPRQEIGTRSIFNLLGPLANPAAVKRLLLGVFDRSLLEPIAEVLNRLGAERAWVVHGEDGIDELTVSGASFVAELAAGQVRSFTVTPEDAGLGRAAPDDLVGGDAEVNAVAIRDLFEGATGAYHQIVVLNAAAALVVAEVAEGLMDGAARAAAALKSGAALEKLNALIEISNQSGNL